MHFPLLFVSDVLMYTSKIHPYVNHAYKIPHTAITHLSHPTYISTIPNTSQPSQIHPEYIVNASRFEALPPYRDIVKWLMH